MKEYPAGRRGDDSRKRKFHRKSRRGCGNCKMRRVKCDEARPKCQKCLCYGVMCDYVSDVENLHMVNEVVSPVISADGTDSLELDSECVNLLTRFGLLTASTVVDIDQKVLLELALSNPYLMHATLALTALHDRYLSIGTVGEQTWRETYHASQSAALFNRKLSQPILAQDRDTLWITATFLGILAFSSITPETPEKAWPLKTPEPSDLEWLRMCEGKMVIWEIANPLQSESLFRSMAEELQEMYTRDPKARVEYVPLALMCLCLLTPSSSTANNPYYTAVRTLIPLLGSKPENMTRSKVLSFTTQMQSEFRELLHDRDPVALLLLALWYEKSRHLVWWVRHRATTECLAISLHLRRYHWGNATIMNLLPCIGRGPH